MGKKSKRSRNVLRDTLSRLATTVKADAPTVVLNPSKGGTELGSPRPSRVARLTGHFNPFSTQRVADRKSKRQLKKIAKQMNANAPKVRKSRLPFVIAFAVALLCGAGYWIYDKIDLPDVKISEHLDYKKWLDTVSGNDKPGKKPTMTVSSSKGSVRKVAEKRSERTLAQPKKSVVTFSKKVATKPLSKAQKKAAAKKEKSFRKLSKSQKEKVWKEKLAKLKKESNSKTRKASHRRN